MAWSLVEKKRLSGSKFKEVWKWSESSATADGETDALVVENADNIVIHIDTTNTGGDPDETVEFGLYAKLVEDASFASLNKTYSFDVNGGSKIELLITEYQSVKVSWTVGGTSPEFSFDIYIAKIEKAGR